MAFSGALTLTDLNDFITPSQACIKPVEQIRTQEEVGEDQGGASTEIRIDSSGSYYEVTTRPAVEDAIVPNEAPLTTNKGTSGKKLEQAQISLNDCLACSGCITSAESVLITLQSHIEVSNFLEENASISPPDQQKIPVISISPQSLASLAASISSNSSQPYITSRQILRRLRVFCKEVLGFRCVFDTTFARHVALREHVKEFIERKEKHRLRNSGGAGSNSTDLQLPMLSSACPGWICYAEKAHPEMLPFISNTKSPQQTMGTLVKEWMGRKWGKSPDRVYHVTVMPCYDKKLEASRSDFYHEVYSTRDVDCVITTGELERLLQEKSFNLAVPVSGESDPPFISSTTSLVSKDKTESELLSSTGVDPGVSDYTLPELVQHPGSSSGSYLHSVISHVIEASEFSLELSVKQIRNADYEEYVLRKINGGEEGKGEVVFKGAKCYGFRNLQNVVRKIGKESGVRTSAGAAGKLAGRAAVARRGRKSAMDGSGTIENVGYDYVEVMACPGGCVNGGGQLKPPSTAMKGMLLDEEGFTRDWEDNGASVEGGSDARWGNKKWNKKVEEAYWHDLSETGGSPDGDTKDKEEEFGEIKIAGQSWMSHLTQITDQLYIDITQELCRKRPFQGSHWPFRTQYRAVESEVIGLAVKW